MRFYSEEFSWNQVSQQEKKILDLWIGELVKHKKHTTIALQDLSADDIFLILQGRINKSVEIDGKMRLTDVLRRWEFFHNEPLSKEKVVWENDESIDHDDLKRLLDIIMNDEETPKDIETEFDEKMNSQQSRVVHEAIPNPYILKCMTPARVLKIAQEDMLTWKFPWLQQRYIRYLAALHNSNDKFLRSLGSSSNKKVVQWVLNQWEYPLVSMLPAVRALGQTRFDVQLAQKEIASLLWTSRQTVNTYLNELESLKLIRQVGNKIIIPEISSLEEHYENM